jgi:hypothetical protein
MIRAGSKCQATPQDSYFHFGDITRFNVLDKQHGILLIVPSALAS